MFNKSKFIESQTSCVDMRHCSKIIMAKIVIYFFSGKMKLHDLSLAQLLKLTSMLGMLMLDDQMKKTSDFIIKTDFFISIDVVNLNDFIFWLVKMMWRYCFILHRGLVR